MWMLLTWHNSSICSKSHFSVLITLSAWGLIISTINAWMNLLRQLILMICMQHSTGNVVCGKKIGQFHFVFSSRSLAELKAFWIFANVLRIFTRMTSSLPDIFLIQLPRNMQSQILKKKRKNFSNHFLHLMSNQTNHLKSSRIVIQNLRFSLILCRVAYQQ